MANTIEYVYQLVDRYTPQLSRMRMAQKTFAKDIDRAKGDLANFQSGIRTFTTVAAVGAVGGLTAAVAGMVNEASKIENVTAAFTPLMGSAEKATELVNRLNTEAATTPFQFENIAGVANQLLPLMEGDINRVADTFRFLGDTAGGNAQKLESIARGYSKALGKGKADMEALNMITEAGVPILDQMSKKYGVSINKLYEMSSAGEITSQMLTDTFKTMTSEGGIFFKGMEISSETFSGVMSTLKDNIALTMAEMGSVALPILKEYAKKATDVAQAAKAWAQNNKEVIKANFEKFFKTIKNIVTVAIAAGKAMYNLFKVIKPILPLIVGIAVAWKAYRISMMAAVAIGPVVKFVGIIMRMAKAQQGVNAAQAIFNALVRANPIGMIITAVGVAIGLFYILYTRSETFRNIVHAAGRILKTVVLFHIKAIVTTVKALISFAGKLKDSFMNIITSDSFSGLRVIFDLLFPIFSIIQEIRMRWEYIKLSFSEGGVAGILRGFQAIGKTLLSGVLRPFEKVLEVAAKFDPTGLAQKGLDKIASFRESMFADEEEMRRKKEAAEKEAAKNIEAINKELSAQNIKKMQYEKQMALDKNKAISDSAKKAADDASKASDKMAQRVTATAGDIAKQKSDFEKKYVREKTQAELTVDRIRRSLRTGTAEQRIGKVKGVVSGMPEVSSIVTNPQVNNLQTVKVPERTAPTTQNVNVDVGLTVVKEKGIEVKPYKATGNTGVNMRYLTK